MFDKKVNSLLSTQQKAAQNQFLKAALKAAAVTQSGNGALKYNTSGDELVDDFASIALYKNPRNYQEVAKTMQLLWSIHPQSCLKLAVYIRLITRKPDVIKNKEKETLDTQRGQGLKNEGIMRMLWLAINQPDTFKANIPYFIAAGSWKDIIQMLSLDLQYHGWQNRKLDWNFLYITILAGLNNPDTTHLVRKYLPTIRTNKNCTTLESQADTLIGRWLAHRFNPKAEKETAYKLYRQLKAKGTAHEWQQLISKQLYDEINFGHIAGRALALLVGSKFLANHGLTEKYSQWVKKQTTIKYTGYAFELFAPLGDGPRAFHIEKHMEATINAQFAQLVKTGREGVNANSGFLVARDVSGSMTSQAAGCKMSSFGVAKAMALYFSKFLKGPFANAYIEFADTCKMRQWTGNTPCDQWVNDKSSDFGSTNFLSIATLFANLKKRGIPEEEFPTGLLCISD